mgnify:CR=1 FL=1
MTATVMEVLVSISMDHMEFLGSTLAEIAWNKAGIIKKHTPVVSWPQQPEALEVIRQVCEKQEASLSVLREEEITDRVYGLREQKFSYRGLELTIIWREPARWKTPPWPPWPGSMVPTTTRKALWTGS